MNLPVFYEPVIDNVYLEDFYKNPARYGFPLQVRRYTCVAIWTLTSLPLPHTLYRAGVLTEQTVSTAPADHLAGEGWGTRQNYL